MCTEYHYLTTSLPLGLTPQQENWLEGVIYRNVSGSWPLLSWSQSTALLKNVRAFQTITEIANYPYHQAGMLHTEYHVVLVWYNVGNLHLRLVTVDLCTALLNFMVVEVWYSDMNRTKILHYDDVGDGAAWTGRSVWNDTNTKT